MTGGVRNLVRLNQEAGIRLAISIAVSVDSERRDRVPLDVVELDHLGVRQRTLIRLVRGVVRVAPCTPVAGLRAPGTEVRTGNAFTLSLRIPRIDLDIDDGTPGALGDPAHLLRMPSVGIHEDVEDRDALHERSVVAGIDVEFGFDVAIDIVAIVDALLATLGTGAAIRVVRLDAVGRFDFRLLGELVADLQPGVAGDDPVEHREAEVSLEIVLAPGVVENLLGDNGLRSLLGLAGIHHEPRIVDRNGRRHHVHRREDEVDNELIRAGLLIPVLARVQIDETPPLFVITEPRTRRAPPLRPLELVPSKRQELLIVHSLRHQVAPQCP